MIEYGIRVIWVCLLDKEMERTYRIIVAGGRDFKNYDLLKKNLDEIFIYFREQKKDFEIVSGLAKGADTLGKKYGEDNGIHVEEFPANWDEYGRSAGYKRNEQMAIYADICICFWDGKSRGTKHMMDLSKRHGLSLFVVNY